MKIRINTQRIFWLVGLLFLIAIPVAKAFDDDDECILCDVAAGMAVAMCEEFAACRTLLNILTLTSIALALIGCICGGPRGRSEIWEKSPSLKNIGRSTIGYGLGRSLIG